MKKLKGNSIELYKLYKLSKLHKDVLCLFFLTAVIAIFFVRLFLPKISLFITPEFAGSDITLSNLPAKYALSESLRRGELPLWNKNIGTGVPLLADSLVGAFYIPNLILFKFFPFPLAFNLSYLTAFIIAAAGTYFFAKSVGMGRTASLFSALIFSLSGFLVTHINHLNLITAVSLTPWIMFYSGKLFKKKTVSNLIILSFFVSQQIFAGHGQISFITLLFVIGYIIFLSGINRKTLIVNLVFVFAAYAISALLSLVQILPTRELMSLSVHSSGYRQSGATFFSYPWRHFLTFINPFFLGSPAIGTYPDYQKFGGSIFWENTGYIGLIPLIFAPLSLTAFKKNKLILFFLISVLVSALLMTGKFSPLYFIFSFPPFNFFRVPSRFLLIFVFSLSIMSGAGLQFLKRIYPFCATWAVRTKPKAKEHAHGVAKRGIELVTIIIFILTLADIFFNWFNYHPVYTAQKWLSPPASAQFLKKTNADARIITLPAGEEWFNYYLKSGWSKKEPYFYFRNELAANLNSIWSIPQIQSYVLFPTRRYSIMDKLLMENISLKGKKIKLNSLSKKLLSLLNTRYIISSFSLNDSQFIQSSVDRQYNIYESKKNLGRAKIVYDYKTADTLEKIIKYISEEDLAKTAILEKNINLGDLKDVQQRKDYSIKWIKDENLKVDMLVKSDSPGLLILADSFFPGWKAYINGKETEIYPANLNQRAVKIAAGQNKVSFIYDPVSFNFGRAVSISSHIIIIFLLGFPFFSLIGSKFSKLRWRALHP